MLKSVEIIPQFPALTESEIEAIEIQLKSRFNYQRLPEEYKHFLQKTNGYLFQTDEEEDIRLIYELNLPFIEAISVVGIFGIWQSKYENIPDTHPEWPELFASNENSREHFDILPDDMMSFAYEDEASGSLFTISLANKDFGKVYLYYDDYMYSIACQGRMIEKYGYCYFEKKIEDILKKYNINEKTIASLKEGGNLYNTRAAMQLNNLTQDCIFELERVSFIPIAPSFKHFIDDLKIKHD